MAKRILVIASLFLVTIYVSDAQIQQDSLTAPSDRRFLFPQMPVENGIVARDPCPSLDAQYPQSPCSPPQQKLQLDESLPYLSSYQSQPIPQAPPRPILPPWFNDYNRYPFANDKQIDDRTFPTIPEEDVPSQYVK